MEKTSLDYAVIEITRKCNMSCSHCLRGDPENVDIDLAHVDAFFEQVNSIGTLTITGGEPSLRPDLIMGIVEAASANGVEIGSFYIVTNAKKVTQEFTHAVMKLYWYCSDNEVSQLSISNDAYHDNLDRDNVKMLRALSL